MADVISSGRRYDAVVGDVNGYGVPGGIYQHRSRTVVNITGLDNTGVTDASGIIQGFIDSASANTALAIPAGTFRLNTGINVGVRSDGTAAKANITLRGAGMGTTTLMLYGGASVSVSGGGGWPTYYPTACYLAADVAPGATVATMDSSPDTAPGLNFILDGNHDPDIPVVSAGGDALNSRPVYLSTTATSGNTVTFWPPLPFTLKAGSRFTRELGTGSPHYVIHTTGIGLEDLTVDGLNSTSQITVGMFSTRASWIYNVEVKNVKNYGINAAFNLQSSIVHCKVHDQEDSYPSFSSRNLILMAASTLMLVEDNIIYNAYSAFELNAGVTLSAFSHNFCDRIAIRDSIGSVFNINHGPHNSFNVYEGNIAGRIQSDGYFGSSSDEMLHRNWFHGTNGVHTTDWATATTVTGNRLPVTLNRFSRNFNIVGNLLGRTGAGVTWDFNNAGPRYDTTSTSSVSIGTGSKSFTFGTGLSYNDNGTCAIVYSASDPTKWMSGRILSYNSGTGTCTLTSYRSNGSGTFNDWIVKGGGGYGSDTIYAFGGPRIGNGGLWFEAGSIVAPQTLGIWWPVWDGRRPTRRGAYDSGTVYNQSGSGPTGSADVVGFYAPTQYVYSGGLDVLDWIANNQAKSGTATWDTPGSSSVDWLPLSANSYSELDYDVYSTAIIKDNWNAFTGGIYSTEALGGDTYPISRIRSGGTAPNFFGSSLSYPAFDSHAPNQSFEAIPAGYRYIHDEEVPGYNPDDSGDAPTVVPDDPTGLTATAVSASQINLSWTRNADNNTSVKVYRGTTSGVLSLLATLSAGATSYSSTSLLASTQYFYEVVNSNVIGNSNPSNEASDTTDANPSPPNAPSGLSATAISSSQISIFWTDNSNNETGFKIYRGLVSEYQAGSLSFVDMAPAGSTSYTSTGLAAETRYFFTVSATNGDGDSAQSNEANDITFADTPPGGLNVETLNVTTLSLSA